MRVVKYSRDSYMTSTQHGQALSTSYRNTAMVEIYFDEQEDIDIEKLKKKLNVDTILFQPISRPYNRFDIMDFEE